MEGALACARLGLRVFPVWGASEGACLCPDGEQCGSPAKHPIEDRWQGLATTNVRRVEHWGKLYRHCNFGVLGDDLVTVDVDPKNGGSLDTLPDWLPKTNWVVATGGGGWHLGYAAPEGRVRNAKLGPGLDLKATGGYVVAPGSLHASGERYRWVSRPGPDAFVPWPTDRQTGPTEGGTEVAARSHLVTLLAAPAQVGDRNNWLAAVAGHYAKAFKFRDAYEVHVRRAADLLSEALEEEEIRKTLDSIWTVEHTKPSEDVGVWTPFDLAKVIANPPPAPERFGPGQMFYRGEVHWLAGEPESGKSIVAYAAAVEEMGNEHTVLILDEDAGVRDAAVKLAALGASARAAQELLVYMPPSGRDLFKDWSKLVELVLEHRPGLCIIDAAADHLAAADKDEDRARDVTSFINRVLKPLAHQHGICVCVIDHKTKADPGSRYARASGSKLAKTEVGYNVAAPEPFSRAKSGRIHVTCTKDKPGYIGRDTSWMMRVNVSEGGGRIELRVGDPMTAEDTKKVMGQVASGLGERVVEMLEGSAVRLTVAEMLAAFDGSVSRSRLSRVLNDLRREGRLTWEQEHLRAEKRWGVLDRT